jgi:hypothetical protein
VLYISFEGYWQLRMALDPDPNDEPLGYSGPTRVVPGEPIFDRIIRFNDPVKPRFPHDEDIGVSVYRVQTDEAGVHNTLKTHPDHPLLGARVDLLDEAKFEERGFVTLYQKMPIEPFHLKIEGSGIRLQVNDMWDPTQPNLTYDEVCADQPQLLSRRSLSVQPGSPVVAEATGIMDYAEYRRARRKQLEERRTKLSDETERNALTVRIDDLAKDDKSTPTSGLVGLTVPAQQFLGLVGLYQFLLQGIPVVSDKHGRLNGKIGTSQQWSIQFWMGGFDVDALTAFIRGTLTVPFAPESHSAVTSHSRALSV